MQNKPKFQVGQKIFYLAGQFDDGKTLHWIFCRNNHPVICAVCQATIQSISIDNQGIRYTIEEGYGNITLEEEEILETKEQAKIKMEEFLNAK